MIACVFSDLHGNLPAIEALIKREENYVDLFLSLGDFVNYGPWSSECVVLIESLSKCIKIKGNHEDYFLNKSARPRSELACQFLSHCIENFYGFDFIRKYEDSINFNGVLLRHTIDDNYIYPETNIDFEGRYFIGHSHIQFYKKTSTGFILNPGSLGQNRKNLTCAEYAIYDFSTGKFELKSINVNATALLKEMRVKKFPEICIEYYLRKIL